MESAKEERMKTSRDICGFKSCKEDVEQKMMKEIQVFSSLFPYNEWKEEWEQTSVLLSFDSYRVKSVR